MTSAAWRAAHPEYVARERERLRRRNRGDRTAERARARDRARAERASRDLQAAAAVDHPILRAAAAYVPTMRSAPGAALVFPKEALREEAVQVAALALLEHRDPAPAVGAFLAQERAWLRITTEINRVG